MKVITVKQPFASLIAEGFKEYEFRTWRTKYRGDLLIHAGKGIDKKAMKRYEHFNLSYPTGCIIARTKLVDCVKVDDALRKDLAEKDTLIYHGVVKHPEWEGYGFKLEKTEKIEPISMNGKLSLWEYDYEENVSVKSFGDF